ncbi:PadR family transcriptional regulator [Microbacterium sp. YJN-G]|uniref:PadR family transcriptional regulator n=1 Tax=Microbacterium sp. YJN-G TaxID=2763257 RepID=UPI001D0C091A|nr:PadR family transcriptional regulator [Microbacterium sp. YJN-G]
MTSGSRAEIDRAGLPLAVLSLLAVAPGHGYALIERLREQGFERIQGGTLYPLLRRLEERGLVHHEWLHEESGPGRKEFSITDAGLAELSAARREWARMGAIINGEGR